MSSMSKVFHEAPGRRADYESVTDTTEKDYPMQFVTHSWVENDVFSKKSKADMVKNYGSSFLMAIFTQIQTSWSTKTWTQHQP